MTAEYRPFVYEQGVFTDVTLWAAKGRWTDADLVRFRYGLPETFGGWDNYADSVTFDGTPRNATQWSTLAGTEIVACASESRLQLLSGGVKYDITPLDYYATTATNSTPVTTNATTTVEIAATGHDLAVGDAVKIEGVGTVDGIVINGVWKVATVPDADTFTFTHFSAATGSTSGGGSTGTIARTMDTLGTNPISTADGSTTVTVTQTGHNSAVGESIVISGASTGNGVDPNGTWFVASVPDANTLTFTYTSAATASGSIGGSSVRLGHLINKGATTGSSLRTPTMGAWGEDLAFCPGPDTNVYLWDATDGLSGRAREIYEAPTADFLLVSSEDKHLILFGKDGDDLLMAWCDQGNIQEWTALSTTTAGDVRFFRGSTFQCAITTTRENLVWTNTGLHSMQFVGGNDVFAIDFIGTTTILGPLAATEYDGVVYWMGNGNFHRFDGRIAPIPSSMWRRVYDNLDSNNARKAFVCSNTEDNEIFFHYPSTSGTGDNDKYALHNTVDGWWAPGGSMPRNAWIDRGIEFSPLGIAADGTIYQHETGTSADGSLMPAFIESGINEGDGDHMVWHTGFMPNAVAAGKYEVVLSFYRRPDTQSPVTKGPYRITPGTTVKVKARGRGLGWKIRLQNPVNTLEELATESGEIITTESAEDLTTEGVLKDITVELLTFWRMGIFKHAVKLVGRQ